MISSHTARRSAATNMYLTGRWKTFQIMAITGHTTEESFFRYIKVSKTDVAKQMAGDSYFKK
jgi:integrase